MFLVASLVLSSVIKRFLPVFQYGGADAVSASGEERDSIGPRLYCWLFIMQKICPRRRRRLKAPIEPVSLDRRYGRSNSARKVCRFVAKSCARDTPACVCQRKHSDACRTRYIYRKIPSCKFRLITDPSKPRLFETMVARRSELFVPLTIRGRRYLKLSKRDSRGEKEER